MVSPELSGEVYRKPFISCMFGCAMQPHAFIKRWSNEVPTLYFLDICAVNATKIPKENVKIDTRKAKLVERLIRLDKSHNSFSYLLALAEKVSDSRGKMSNDELLEQVLRDVAALRAFFVKSRIIEPDEFLISYTQDLYQVPHEVAHDAYIKFLRIANDRLDLGNAVAKPHRLRKAEEILMEADALAIGRQHPVVLVTLACLYGNSSAKRVMKFKANTVRFDAENALADIMIISRFFPEKLKMEQAGREWKTSYDQCDFITDDDGLLGILRCFEAKNARLEKIENLYRTYIEVKLNFRLLFTEISSLN
ncbi:hypothetical protein [Methylobacterium bullatum]|uniref:Uncharacterized protein n=1 Tax=Methylobacterium bullatum TaxID=570505 RepID=A0A679JWU5_9HYPH|nr:hypothetical protein MBLL_04210 [Methylobacterium bullatum]